MQLLLLIILKPLWVCIHTIFFFECFFCVCHHFPSRGSWCALSSQDPLCAFLTQVHWTYQILSVGGGGMLTASVPRHSWTSTVSSSGVLDTSSIFFLMNSVSVAFWKYLDLAILSTKRIILLGLWPPTKLQCGEWEVCHLSRTTSVLCIADLCATDVWWQRKYCCRCYSPLASSRNGLVTEEFRRIFFIWWASTRWFLIAVCQAVRPWPWPVSQTQTH